MTRKYFIVIFSFLFLLQTESICNYIIPPGTVLLDRKTATYMDASEITVFAWAEYLYWVKENNGENSDEYKNALPDSATCEKLYGVKPNSIGGLRFIVVPYTITYFGLKTDYKLDLYKIWRNQAISDNLSNLIFE